MKLCHALKEAIDSVDLTSEQGRRGAAALAIVLLEKVYFAEENELDWASIILDRFEWFENESAYYENNLRQLRGAVSALYNAYGLYRFRRLGILGYIRKYGEALYSD